MCNDLRKESYKVLYFLNLVRIPAAVLTFNNFIIKEESFEHRTEKI